MRGYPNLAIAAFFHTHQRLFDARNSLPLSQLCRVKNPLSTVYYLRLRVAGISGDQLGVSAYFITAPQKQSHGITYPAGFGRLVSGTGNIVDELNAFCKHSRQES